MGNWLTSCQVKEEAGTGITPTPHTMFFQRGPEPSEASGSKGNNYRAALDAQHAKAPGAKPLPQHFGLPHGAEVDAAAAHAAAVHEEARAVKAAEAQLHMHQQAAVQQQGGGDRPESVEEMFGKETQLREELAKQMTQISEKHTSYCHREMAVQARMVERETKMQENSVNQEKVSEEMNRLRAVLMLRENVEDKTLLDEFTAFDNKLSEKHQEYMSLQHEDVAKQKRLAEKTVTLQEHHERLVDLQVKNQKSLQALEARMKQQQPSGDLRSIAGKRLLSQLMAAEKADTERASLRKDLKARKTLTSKETEVEESRQEQMALEAIAMQEQQQRQQRLQDDRIQAEQQAKANAYAILQQQEQAEQQEAMAQAEAKAVAEQEEQRRQLLQEEQQRQQEWQKYLRGKMVEEKNVKKLCMQSTNKSKST